MLLAFPGLSFGGVSALLLYCSLSLLTPKTFTPPRFTLPYAEALYPALRRSALPCLTPTRFYLDVQPRPYFIFHFFSKQLVSQKLKMVTIDAILNHLLTIVET
jgi:hypothetical protein